MFSKVQVIKIHLAVNRRSWWKLCKTVVKAMKAVGYTFLHVNKIRWLFVNKSGFYLPFPNLVVQLCRLKTIFKHHFDLCNTSNKLHAGPLMFFFAYIEYHIKLFFLLSLQSNTYKSFLESICELSKSGLFRFIYFSVYRKRLICSEKRKEGHLIHCVSGWFQYM